MSETIADIHRTIAELSAAQEAARDAVRDAVIATARAQAEWAHTTGLAATLASLAKAAQAPRAGKKTTKGR